MKLLQMIKAIRETHALLLELRPILDELKELSAETKEPIQLTQSKRRGRPKGSKNKPKFSGLAERAQAAANG